MSSLMCCLGFRSSARPEPPATASPACCLRFSPSGSPLGRQGTPGGLGWQGAPPDSELWLTDEALSAPLELFLYRVHQLFLDHVQDIETMDHTVQYLLLLLGMNSPAIATRLLRCNTRLLLSNILACKTITPRLRKEATECLDALHAHALGQAQITLTGALDSPLPVTQKPPMPTLPNGAVPLSLMGAAGSPTPAPAAEGETTVEDQAYLEGVGLHHLFREIAANLLAARPPREKVPEFIARALEERFGATKDAKDSKSASKTKSRSRA
eukprot:TRINITY_DN13007_c0_g1_i1.p1 TRINITY_DN13007_c0_g1~~TRINITY_DN13007_c0_g1_i1.p1  ORF type:complete len:269 (-),score=56.18 TRINITY_DN13007_c0_g1_i1:429-1235(-)